MSITLLEGLRAMAGRTSDKSWNVRSRPQPGIALTYMFDPNSINTLFLIQALQEFNRPAPHAQHAEPRPSLLRRLLSVITSWLKTQRATTAVASEVEEEDVIAHLDSKPSSGGAKRAA